MHSSEAWIAEPRGGVGDVEALEGDLRSVRQLARATAVSHHVATRRFVRGVLSARGAPYLRGAEAMALLDADVRAAIAAS